MRQTVIGVYDSYVDASSAQRALCEAGVAQADIAIYSTSVSAPAEKGPRVYAPGGGVRHHTPVFDQLEQLFARIFERGKYPPEAEDYREFVRRGGTILSADVSEMQVVMTRDVMRRKGAADIEERMDMWRKETGTTDTGEDRQGTLHRGRAMAREPSLQNGAPGGQPGGAVTAEEPPMLREEFDTAERNMGASEGRTDGPGSTRDAPRVGDVPVMDDDEPGVASNRPAMVSGMQQVTTRTTEPGAPPSSQQEQRQVSDVPDVGVARTSADVSARLRGSMERPSESSTAAAHAERPATRGLVGDPVMGTPLEDDPYDDEFRKDFDAHYADTGSSYDEYRRAYTHGATLGQDERYREQDWQRVEPSAREDWEARYPESGWERFKAAVRHGWERVAGH